MKLNSMLALTLVLIAALACGGGASGPKAALDKMAGITEALVAALDKADSPATVAAAFNGYSDSMEKLIPELKALMQSHPELKGKIGVKGDVPAEYKEPMDRIVKAGEKMFDLMNKLAPHLSDEAVQKAQQRFSEVMARME